MQEKEFLTFLSKRKRIVVNTYSILYVLSVGKSVEVHLADGHIHETRMRLAEMELALPKGFIRIHRGCLVSVKAIHNITDRINLSNGESLFYALRKRCRIIEQFNALRKEIINGFRANGTPQTNEEYHHHYLGFDTLPVAFADIELVFDKKKEAIDWIFRYANPALALLEKLPLEQLIDHSFGSLFSNMDAKWLHVYERATLYGEKIDITDYSPEIDTTLKIICFPTFPGHCGCILMNLSDVRILSGTLEESCAHAPTDNKE